MGGHPVGVITDRDIVCRVVADGQDPASHTAGEFMSRPVFTVGADAPIDEVLSVMEEHRIRRVPVLDGDGCCAGIIAQADIASAGDRRYIAELVSEVSRHTGEGIAVAGGGCVESVLTPRTRLRFVVNVAGVDAPDGSPGRSTGHADAKQATPNQNQQFLTLPKLQPKRSVDASR